MQKETFLLFAGLVVAVWIGAMVVMFSTGGNAAGSGNGSQGEVQVQVAAAAGEAQDVYVRALGTGLYDKQQVTVKKGIPVRFHFSAEPNAGCGRMIIIDGFNQKAISRNGEEQVMQFTPTQAGRYPYHCGMNMFRGVLVVV